jgi:hypothetical protein
MVLKIDARIFKIDARIFDIDARIFKIDARISIRFWRLVHLAAELRTPRTTPVFSPPVITLMQLDINLVIPIPRKMNPISSKWLSEIEEFS